MGVQDCWLGQESACEGLEALPCPPAALTAPPQRKQPVSRCLPPERLELWQITGYSVVIEIPAHHLLQPFAGFRDRRVHSPAKFRLYRLQLRAQTPAHRLSLHRKFAAFPDRAADVRESQKVKCLRFPRPSPLPVLCRKPPEFNQACLLRVQFQSVFGHALLQLLQKPLSFPPVLKPQHKVIRIPDDHHIAPCEFPAPLFCPLVERVMQVDIGKQRRDHRSLWRTHLRLRPLPLFRYPGRQPLPDQPLYPPTRYPQLDQLHQLFMTD